MQRVCEEGGEAVPKTIVKEVALAREGVGAKAENETLFYRSTDMKAKLVEARFAKSTMREHLAWTERRITTLTTQLKKSQLALEKLTGVLSKTEANLWACVVVVEDTLSVERARFKYLECDVVAEIK